MTILHTILLLLAIAAVGIADVFLKKTQALGSMGAALMSPWMFGAIILYLFQIFFFTYIFMSGAKLTYIGIMQTVLYAIIVIGSGVFIFGESLTPVQIAGAVLAVLGVILLNIH